MFVWECYCPMDDDSFGMETDTPFRVMNYIGEGRLKCPKCDNIKDLSAYTFKLKVAVGVKTQKYNTICGQVKDFMSILLRCERFGGHEVTCDDIDMMEEEVLESGEELFQELNCGVHEVHLYFHPYTVSNPEVGTEHDVDVEVLYTKSLLDLGLQLCRRGREHKLINEELIEEDLHGEERNVFTFDQLRSHYTEEEIKEAKRLKDRIQELFKTINVSRNDMGYEFLIDNKWYGVYENTIRCAECEDNCVHLLAFTLARR